MATRNEYRRDLSPATKAILDRMAGHVDKHGHPRAWMRRSAKYHLIKLRGHLDRYEAGLIDPEDRTLDDHLVAIMCRASFVYLKRRKPRKTVWARRSDHAQRAAEQLWQYLFTEQFPAGVSVGRSITARSTRARST